MKKQTEKDVFVNRPASWTSEGTAALAEPLMFDSQSDTLTALFYLRFLLRPDLESPIPSTWCPCRG